MFLLWMVQWLERCFLRMILWTHPGLTFIKIQGFKQSLVTNLLCLLSTFWSHIWETPINNSLFYCFYCLSDVHYRVCNCIYYTYIKIYRWIWKYFYVLAAESSFPGLSLGLFVVHQEKDYETAVSLSIFHMVVHWLWHSLMLTGFSQSRGYRNAICSLLQRLDWKSVKAVANLQVFLELNSHIFFTAVARENAQ